MKLWVRALLACMIITGWSCKDDLTDSLTAIDQPLNLSIGEQLGAVRSLVIHAATQQMYHCTNYTLAYSQTSADTTFTIAIDNVHEAAACTQGNAPARSDISLGAPAKGTYRLLLRVNGISSTAMLVVTDTSYAVTGGESRWVTFTKSAGYKVPANTIWGYMQSGDPNAATVYRAFVDSLALLGAQSRAYAPGDYGFYSINAAGEVVNTWSGSIFVKTFIFQYDGDMIALRDLLKQFGQAHRNQLDIILYGSRGEYYQASVLAGS